MVTKEKGRHLLKKDHLLKLLFTFLIIKIKVLLSSLYEYCSYDSSPLASKECTAFVGAGPFAGKLTVRGALRMQVLCITCLLCDLESSNQIIL